MALPTAYLTSTKNADAILEAIKRAQAPPRFTQKFLEGLGFSSVADRLYINVLKALASLTIRESLLSDIMSSWMLRNPNEYSPRASEMPMRIYSRSAPTRCSEA